MRPDSSSPCSPRPNGSDRDAGRRSRGNLLSAVEPDRGLLFAELARRYLANRELIGLKRTTLMDYESYTRVHLVPAFGGLRARGDHDRADRGVHRRQAPGREGGQEHPQLPGAAARDVRVRGQARLVRPQPGRARREAARPTQPGHPLSRRRRSSRRCSRRHRPTRRGTTERVLYLTAAMTGLRRGELLALRWQDIDWTAGVVRVRRNYTRGQFGTPKSRRSSRAVPLAATRPRRTPAALRAVALPGADRPRLLPPAARRRARPRKAPQALPGRSPTGRAPTGPLPRSPPHLRHPHGRRRRTPAMRSRNGSATATTAPPRSTPTTRPTSPKPPTGPHAPSPARAMTGLRVRAPARRRSRRQATDDDPAAPRTPPRRTGNAPARPNRQRTRTGRALRLRHRPRRAGASFALLLNRATDRPAQPLAFGLFDCAGANAWWGGPTFENFALVELARPTGPDDRWRPNGLERRFLTARTAVWLPGRDPRTIDSTARSRLPRLALALRRRGRPLQRARPGTARERRLALRSRTEHACSATPARGSARERRGIAVDLARSCPGPARRSAAGLRVPLLRERGQCRCRLRREDAGAGEHLRCRRGRVVDPCPGRSLGWVAWFFPQSEGGRPNERLRGGPDRRDRRDR